MSVNSPSGLGTLLVQRLDAVLGTTLSQQTNIVNGARPDAITQTQEAQRNEAAQNRVTRETREAIDQVQRHGEKATRQAVERAKIDAHKSLLDGDTNQPNTRATPSAPTSLGTAARAILALLQNFPEQTAVVRGRQPLIQPQGQQTNQNTAGNTTANTQSTGAGQNAMQARGAAPMPQAQISSQALAQTLSQTVQSSGLFYESHLSALSFGKFAASALRAEPQAMLGSAPNNQSSSTAQTPSSSNTANPQSSTQTNTSLPQSTQSGTAQNAVSSSGVGMAKAEAGSNPSVQTGQGSSSTTPAGTHSATNITTGQSAAASNTALAVLHPETHTIVRQQLEVLANQGLLWRGEAWPGTDLEMHIQRREQDGADHENDFAQWSTRLKLTLPRLGDVDVRLSLNGAAVQMAIVAPASAPVLRENAAILHDRLNSAGLQLSNITVSQKTAIDNSHVEQTNASEPR